jgi:DNA-binding response OmpR family regulator
LLDLKLPKVDGFEVLWWMNHQGRNARVPTIVLTSSPLESDKARSLELGATEFFTKQYDFDGLGDRLERLLKKNRTR